MINIYDSIILNTTLFSFASIAAAVRCGAIFCLLIMFLIRKLKRIVALNKLTNLSQRVKPSLLSLMPSMGVL